jgi:hypothetical protein
MTHQLHREPLRDVVPLQEYRPGVARSVEIGIAPRLVEVIDAVTLIVHLQTRSARNAIRKHQSARHKVQGTMQAQSLNDFGHETNALLFLVLGVPTTTKGASVSSLESAQVNCRSSSCRRPERAAMK